MPTLRRRLYGLTMAALLFLPASQALAQKVSDSATVKFDQKMGLLNLGISLLRDPVLPADNFILRLSPLDRSISGCPGIMNLKHSSVQRGRLLEIRIEEVTVDLKGWPKLDCAGKAQTPKADVVLNRKDMKEKGINAVAVASGMFSDQFKVTLTDQKIEMEPQCAPACIGTAKAQNVHGVRNAMQLWFYPENTVLLYAPGAGSVEGMDAYIREMALQKGLAPLEDQYPGFKSPLVRNNVFYYVDKSGTYARDTRIAGGVPVGTARVARTVFGLRGDETGFENVDVYARSPGMYE